MCEVNRLNSGFSCPPSKVEGICLVSGVALAILGGVALGGQLRLPMNAWTLAAPGSALILGVAIARLCPRPCPTEQEQRAAEPGEIIAEATTAEDTREIVVDQEVIPGVSEEELLELRRLRELNSAAHISLGDFRELIEFLRQKSEPAREAINEGRLLQLTQLYLRDNQLTTLPESIGNLTLLTELDLDNNQLTSLPESIGNLTQLTGLALHDNQLTSLSKPLLGP